MSTTHLERARGLHEDLELLEKAMTKELGDPANEKLKRADEVARDQVVATLLDAHTARGVELAAIYADADGARRDEINAMSGSAVFTAFYEQLKGIREYHRKFPIAPSTETYEEALLTEVLAADRHEDGFTGEEAEGRFVDMHALHELSLIHI